VREAETALALFADELQYVQEDQLAALVAALHRASQRRLPVVPVGAGLPRLRGRMGNAKTYAERLFDFPDIGPLPFAAARDAIAKPAAAEGVEFAGAGLRRIMDFTRGYPFLIRGDLSSLRSGPLRESN